MNNDEVGILEDYQIQEYSLEDFRLEGLLDIPSPTTLGDW